MESTQKDAGREVDLLELSGKALTLLGKFFAWVAKQVQVVFIFLLRKTLWFAACVAAVFTVSYSTYRLQRSSYSTMLVAQMNVLDNAFAISYINNQSASLADPQLTKRIFNLPDTVLAKQVKSIAAYWGVSNLPNGKSVDKVDFTWDHTKPAAIHDTMAATRVDDRFFVQASVYSSEVQPYLTKGLVENICSMPHLQELNNLRKVQVREKIAELGRQIRVLDSLQRYEYFVKDAKTVKPAMVGQLMLLNEKEKTLFHSEIMRLYDERQRLERDLQLNPNPVTVVQGFETNLQPEQQFFGIAKRLLFLGLLLTLVAAMAWDNRKWLVEKVKE